MTAEANDPAKGRPSAKVLSGGRVTVPVGVREALGLSPGDAVAFTLGADGQWSVARAEGDAPTARSDAE